MLSGSSVLPGRAGVLAKQQHTRSLNVLETRGGSFRRGYLHCRLDNHCTGGTDPSSVLLHACRASEPGNPAVPAHLHPSSQTSSNSVMPGLRMPSRRPFGSLRASSSSLVPARQTVEPVLALPLRLWAFAKAQYIHTRRRTLPFRLCVGSGFPWDVGYERAIVRLRA